MAEVALPRAGSGGEGAGGAERVFLIADVRGYTRFTRERGDAEAARLATRFAELARDAVEARSGRVIELRGDEALAVFESAPQSIRAALELAAVCADEAASEGGLPLLVGIGIDVGEAVPVEGGFRGAALNMAARLCSQAAGGQVLVTTSLAERSEALPGIRFEAAGTAELKGIEGTVQMVEARREERPRPPARTEPTPPLPLELEPDGPFVDREHQLSWLRGTWRQVEQGYGRVLVVSGEAGIGKTRLAAELAAIAHASGATVSYAGAGGTAAAAARSALEQAATSVTPALLVLDDLDATADAVVSSIEVLLPEIDQQPALVLCLLRDAEGSAAIDGLLAASDGRGDGHRRLAPLDADGVRDIAALYAGEDVEDAPLESIARASAGVPARVHELMSEWAQQEATRRLSAAAEFLAEGRRSRSGNLEFANNVIGLKLGRLYGADQSVELAVGEAPYKGLAAFEEADASLFFGREQLVGELAARTVGTGLLAVVGASGSGKSSVIAAGLVPSLRAGLLPGSEHWRATIVRPGEHPQAELPEIDGKERLVLVVDQFEEVFTLCADEAEREAFVRRLVEIADDPERAVVVLGIRGDFYGHCGAYPELAQLLAANQVLVGPMSPDELRRAVELPARRARVRAESALTEALVEEIGDEPGGLPLLSTALVELWQAREDDWLRLPTYERLGGVRGAVARLAERSYDTLDDEQRGAVRRLFLRLVAIGDEGAVVKRRVPLSELDLDHDRVLAEVVERLTVDRLLTAYESSVEVAHEALLREWPRFQEWLSEDSQDRELREHLTQSAKRWEAAGREPAELYRGARLAAATSWAAQRDEELNELERDFLAESRRHAELEAERQRRQNRRLRILLVGAVVLLLAAVAGGIVALQQRSSAENQAKIALARQLGAQSIVEPRLDRAMLLAREAVRLDRSPQTEGGLLSTLLRTPSAIGTFTVPITVRPLQLTLSPDGHTLAVLDNQSEVLLFDVATRRQVGRLKDTGLPGTQFVYTPDGRFAVAFATDQSGLVLMDIRKQRLAHKLPMDRVFPNNPTSPANPILVTPDGRSALMTYALIDPERHMEGQAYADRWDLRTGKLVASRPLPGASGMYAAQLVDGGRKLVALTNDAAVTFDSTTFRRLKSVPYKLPRGQSPGLISIMSPDGREAAIPTSQGVDFVDLRTGAVTESVPVPGLIENGAFAPDGHTFVTVGDDRRVLVWEAGKPEPVETLLGHAGRILGLTFAGDGHTLFTSSLDGAVFEWDLSRSRRFGRPFAIGPLIPNAAASSESPPLAISPDSRAMAVSPAPGRISTVSLATSRTHESFEVTHDPQTAVKAIAWPKKSRLLVAWATPPPKMFARGHSNVELWSIAGRPHRVRSFAAPKGTLRTAGQSPDGRLAAAIASDQVSPAGDSVANLVVWDTASGRVLASLRRKHEAGDIAFSRDGSILASTWDDGLLLLDARTGRRLRWIPHQGGVGVVAFAPDGTLATGSDSGIVQLWDPRSGRALSKQSQVAPAPVAAISFDPRGDTFVASGGSDGVPKLWTTRTLQQLGSDLPGDPGMWLTARYTPDGRKIVVVSPTNRAWVWPATLGAWAQHACAVAGRNLTKEEWRRFVGGRSYAKICG